MWWVSKCTDVVHSTKLDDCMLRRNAAMQVIGYFKKPKTIIAMARAHLDVVGTMRQSVYNNLVIGESISWWT